MSYILDALKKAERERGIAKVPTLATVHDLQKMPRTRLWAISGICILCVAVLLLFLIPLLRTNIVPVPSNTGEPDRAAIRPDMEQVRESAAQSPPVRQPIVSREVPPPTAAPSSEEHAVARMPIAVARQSEAQPKTISPIEKALPQPQPNGGTSSFEAPKPAPSAAQVKPTSLREAMAKMIMTVLSYSEAKSERLVFINGRKYVEGDYVDETYFLESITPEGAILTYEGERALLKPGPK